MLRISQAILLLVVLVGLGCGQSNDAPLPSANEVARVPNTVLLQVPGMH